MTKNNETNEIGLEKDSRHQVFKSLPGDWLTWQRSCVVLLNPSWYVPQIRTVSSFSIFSSWFFTDYLVMRRSWIISRDKVAKEIINYSSPPLNQQSEYKVIYELMCWLSASLTCRLPNVMRSPPARRSLVSSFIVDWFLAPHSWGFYLKSKSTNYPDHGHHGETPSTRKIPMVEPGIEPGTSWLVARSSDH